MEGFGLTMSKEHNLLANGRRSLNMKREDALLLLQLLYAMQDTVEKLEKYYERKDAENLARAKREVLELQKRIENLMR